MLNINIQEDELLKNSIDKMISGLLPHDKYDSKLYPDILNKITQLIKPEDTYGEYCVLLKILTEHKRIGTVYSSYDYMVTRDAVLSALDANITELVRSQDVNIGQVLTDAGMDSNIAIESVFDNACSFLYNQVLVLYDQCFELGVSSLEALSYYPAYKTAFVNNIANSSLLNQATILRDSAFIDRKVYHGAEDWLTYLNNVEHLITSRISDDDDGTINVNDVDKGFDLMEECYGMFEPLANYDIPLLDEGTPMMRHRLALIVGNENVGKTSFAINWTNNLIMNGHKVLYMCGETLPAKVYSMLLVNYIQKTQNIYIDRQAIATRGALSEEQQRIVNVANAEYSALGAIRFKKALQYDTLYDELKAEYDKEPFDAIFIDHSCALKGRGDLYENIGKLAMHARNFKNDFPVYIGILSHLSSSAKDILNRGKQLTSNTAKGNSSLDGEADEVFVLSSTEALQSKGQLMLTVTKRRDAARLTEPIILIKKFEACTFFYDPTIQNINDELNTDDLNTLTELYDDDDDEYLLDDDDDF